MRIENILKIQSPAIPQFLLHISNNLLYKILK